MRRPETRLGGEGCRLRAREKLDHFIQLIIIGTFGLGGLGEYCI